MLSDQHCEVCRKDSKPVTEQELAGFLQEHPQWQCLQDAGVNKLRREYQFDDYAQGLKFTNELAALAEKEDHHPDILLQWGKVTLTWWTHSINGLHKNDCIMAAKSDQLNQIS